MEPKETPRQRMTRVAREVGTQLRSQARGRWKEVRTAERNQGGRHVWRFRTAADGGERFLHVEHRSMVRGKDPASRLLEQLASEKWLDRLQEEPGTALLLSSDGRLGSLPAL